MNTKKPKMTKTLIKSKLIKKKTKETEQYSNAKIRMSTKSSRYYFCKKIIFTIGKSEACKSSILYYVE